MRANKANRNFPASMFAVETQKTRAGKKGEEDTRPYRFGDITRCYGSMTTFNILFKNKEDQFSSGSKPA